MSEALVPRGKLGNYSEAYRHECEVRYCAKFPKAKLIDHIIGVREHRGDKAADRLKSAVETYRKFSGR
jgi:hypothetical protein